MMLIFKCDDCPRWRSGNSFFTTGFGLKIGPGNVDGDRDLERRRTRLDVFSQTMILVTSAGLFDPFRGTDAGERSFTYMWRITRLRAYR